MNNRSATALPGLAHEFSHHGLDFRMVKAFGPTILETRLPDAVFKKMLELTDALLADTDRTSYGHNLVGQIREEPEIPIEMLREYDVYSFIHGLFAEYVLGCSFCDANPEYKATVSDFHKRSDYANPVHVDVEAAWLVSQYAGEFNPIHNHSQSTLSSVMYLKVPKQMEKEGIPGKAEVAGNIEWVYRSADLMQNSTMRVKPEAGMFYIFPASLLHLVYPFTSSEERRSVSINATHRL